MAAKKTGDVKTKGPAVLLTTDGKETRVMPANGKRFTLEEVQKLVGGYVERFRVSASVWALCDEDGYSKGLAPNVRASALTGRDLVGPVLFYGNGQF